MNDVDRALDVIRTFTLPDTRQLADTLPDDPWIERDVLRPILERDAEGLPKNRLAWLELPRGHVKTSSIAMVAMVEAITSWGTDVIAIASDADQARLIIEAISGQCFRNPNLAKFFKEGRDEFTVKNNRSRIRVFASDAPSFYGLGVDTRRLRIVCDELCQWRDRAMYDAALTTLPKVHDSQLVVITNAGVIGSWQEEARANVAASGYLFAADGVIASWIRPEDLERLRQNVPPPVFERFYLNRWTLSAGDFITSAMLANCVDTAHTPREGAEDGVQYFVGVDLGLTHDRTVRAVCHYDADREAVTLDSIRVWEGSKDNPVLIDEVERDMLDLDQRFRRPVFIVDPWQLKSTIERLSTVIDIREHVFSGPSVMRLSETLYQLISGGRMRLYPDPDLERELLQLQVRQTAVGWRIDHQRGGFSDRAVALGLAALGAFDFQPERWVMGYVDPLTGELTTEMPDRIRIGADV